MNHPPKPRLTLRVGVTGHRLNRLSAVAPQALRASIGDLLTRIRGTLDAVHMQHRACFSDEPPRLIVVSALAEGADRIVAEVARDLGLDLFCPLPFPRDEYQNDFPDPTSRMTHQRLVGGASVFELDGSRADIDQSYERVGLFVLRQSDLAIAVWNGEAGAGRGGTHDIVQAAIAAGIPLVRYDEHGAGPSLLLPSGGGTPADARDIVSGLHNAEPAELDALIRRLVEPPASNADDSARARLNAYYEEHERRVNYWFAYPLLLRLFASKRGVRKSFRPPPYISSTAASWQTEYWQPIEGACSLDPRYPNKIFTPVNIAEALQPRFAWADGLAVYYGQAYRSSYVLAFALGAFAVLMAVFPIPINLALQALLGKEAAEHAWHHVELWPGLLALASISAVTWLVFRGRQTLRHEKWLDYRLLAERLRVIRVLALTGSPMPELRVPHRDESLKSQQSWVTWYVRATLREIGIPLGRGDAHYAEMAKCALLQAELRGQAAFHKAYAERERSVGEKLERLGKLLFLVSVTVTVLALLVYVSIMMSERSSEGAAVAKIVGSLTMFVAAAFPAIGGALFAMRSHGEFERNAKLSEATYESLTSIIKRVEANGAPSFAFIARATDDTASVITSELSDWRFIFWGKPLTLPG